MFFLWLSPIDVCNEADAERDKENEVPPAGVNVPEVATEPQKEKEKEKELDDEILQVLGEDPSASQALDFDLHSSIATRWRHWVEKGVKKEEREQLFEKYPRREGFIAPELNQVLIAAMSEAAVRRDAYAMKCQQAVGSALMALGAAVSTLLDEPESIDKVAFLENLNDAAKFMAEAHFLLNQSRKALILPGVSKPLKELLEKTKSDTELFGKNLAEKIKEAKALEKMVRSVKNTDNSKSTNRARQTGSRLNFRSPQGKRTFSSYAGNSRPNAQGRQRLSFRGKQQFFNNKASNQRQRPPRK